MIWTVFFDICSDTGIAVWKNRSSKHCAILTGTVALGRARTLIFDEKYSPLFSIEYLAKCVSWFFFQICIRPNMLRVWKIKPYQYHFGIFPLNMALTCLNFMKHVCHHLPKGFSKLNPVTKNHLAPKLEGPAR